MSNATTPPPVPAGELGDSVHRDGALRRFFLTGDTFTLRSLFFSALGIFFISGLASFHDWVLKGSPMIGNQLPVGVFSYLMFVGLFWNGIWRLVDRAWRALAPGAKSGPADVLCLTGREMAVVLVATLLACFPPTSGFFRSRRAKPGRASSTTSTSGPISSRTRGRASAATCSPRPATSASTRRSSRGW